LQLWAIIVDGFRESLDRKIFWVLIALSVLVALSMASIGFEEDRVTFFFGLFGHETDRFNPLTGLGRSTIVGIVVYLLLDALLGWVGLILMIIATAGAFPAFMQRGAIDVVLAKPLSRRWLFLYKYLSGLVFVFVQGAVFVGLTFLVMGLLWGIWAPGYLLAVPLLVLLFSYLYCVSVAVAIKTRSAVAAVLVTIGAWVAFALLHQGPQIFEHYPELKKHTLIYNSMRVGSWIPPKTGDFVYLTAKWAGAGTSMDVIPDEVAAQPDVDPDQLRRAEEIERQELEKSPVYSIGSSLLFEAVILLIAMRGFVRRDY